jgi:outer membrane lipoprotein-sorting protein
MSCRRTVAAIVITASLALPAASPAADPTPTELGEALQRRYDSVKDFTADFVQTYLVGLL